MPLTHTPDPGAPRGGPRWWRQPLVHFLGVGALLFVVDLRLNPPADSDAPPQIEATQELRGALQTAWSQQHGKPLSDAELSKLVEGWTRDEALYREALRLGLDRGDTIVRRRLVQKLEFLLKSTIQVDDPGDEALEAWFLAHADDYRQPTRTSFTHLYFSRARRGEAAHGDAAQALARVGSDPSVDPGTAPPADPFMGPAQLTLATQARVNRDFGGAFAAALSELEVGAWAGPIESSYGHHLVHVSERQAARPARLEERRAEVLTDWHEQARKDKIQEAIAAIVARHARGGS